MEQKRCYGCMKLKKDSPVCEHCGYDERTQNDPHHLSAGTVLKEQYLIGKVLGQGGFGITYLGWDLYLDIPVAVKEYYPAGVVMRDTSVTMDVVSCSGDDGARFRNNKERFLREAKMLARFSQVPEIVQVKNFFLANNTAYIVMEYVEGITLKQYVKDQGGKLSVDETLSILRPVMEGLCKVHKAGLVHRDISPDNIMMLPGGGVKLLDFGAVRDVGAAAVDKQLTKSTEAILKQGYAPIEQYQKRGGLGPWTDVYALCATIYYCLTGEVPPDAPERLLGYEDLNLLEKVTALSEAQAKALEHGMELRAEKRTPSMDELCEELFQTKADASKPESPSDSELKRLLGRQAVTVAAGNNAKRYGLLDGSYTVGKVAGSAEAGYTLTVTVKPDGYLAKYNEDTKTNHRLSANAQPVITLRYDGGAWRLDSSAVLPVRKKQPLYALAIGLVAAAVVLAAALVVPLMTGGGRGADTPPTLEAGDVLSGECGRYATWTLDADTGALVVEGSRWMYDYGQTPEESAPWQAYRDSITSVTITGSVTSVGAWAFAGLENLKTVEIGGAVETIRECAFRGSGVEELRFTAMTGSTEEMEGLIGEAKQASASSLRTIEWAAFWGCRISQLDLPETVQTLGNSAFSFNPIQNLVLPDSVQYVDTGCFDCIDTLETVTIGPDTRLSYRQYWKTTLFGNGQEVEIVGYQNTMAEDYARIKGWQFASFGSSAWDAEGQCGDNAYWHFDLDTGLLLVSGIGEMWNFNGAWMLEEQHQEEFRENWNNDWDLPPWEDYRGRITTVSIGEGITSIGENAFHGCDNWTDVYLSDTLEHLSYQSFCDTKIEELYLPDSVTQIDSFTFNWCGELRSLRLPEGLRKLESNAISECEKLEALYIGADTILSDDPKTPFYNEDATPDGGAPARNLVIYSLPGSDAERFAKQAGIPFATGYRGMAAEAEGQCGDDVWWFKSGDTLVLYGTGSPWLYRVSDSDRAEWANLDWPESWLQYGNPEYYEFRNEIRRIIILPGVKSMQRCLFCDMDQLQEVDFGTVVQVEMNFSNCGSLTELVLPESVVGIGGWALAGCQNLRRVTIENGSSSFSDGLFEGCVSLEEVWFSGKENIGNIDLFSPNGGEYSSHVTFYVKEGSDALRYAKEHGIPYEILTQTE